MIVIRKYILFTVAMLLSAAVSCQRDEKSDSFVKSVKLVVEHELNSGTKVTIGAAESGMSPVLWQAGDCLAMYNADGGKELLGTGSVSESYHMKRQASIFVSLDAGLSDAVSNVRFIYDNGRAYGKALIPSSQQQKGLGSENTNLRKYSYAFSNSLALKESMSFSMKHPLAYVRIPFCSSSFNGWALKTVVLRNEAGGVLAGECTNINGAVAVEKSIQGVVSGTESDMIVVTFEDGVTVSEQMQDVWIVALPTAINGDTPEQEVYSVYFELEKGDVSLTASMKFKTILYPSSVNTLSVEEITTGDVTSDNSLPEAVAGVLNKFESLRYGDYIPADYEIYDYPAEMDFSDRYSVTVEGLESKVMNANPGGLGVYAPTDEVNSKGEHADEPHFTTFGADKPVTVKVKFLKGAPSRVDVRPLSKNYIYTLSGDELTLTLSTYDRISIEPDGDIDSPLFVFVNPVEQEAFKQAVNDPKTRVYEAGKVHELGKMDFMHFKNIYIQGGAVIKGRFEDMSGVSGAHIDGCGILDSRDEGLVSAFQIRNGSSCIIKNITILNRQAWTFRLVLCDDMTVDNVKSIGVCPYNDNWDENDAFHLTGCRNCTLTRLFGYSWDDCFNVAPNFQDVGRESYNVNISDVVTWNVHPGNGSENGWTCAYDNHDHTYTDFYSIHSGTKGAKNFRCGVALHNEGPGTIYNMTYRNIYIEDPAEHGIFIGLHRRYSEVLGHIHDVSFSNVHILKRPPLGCAVRGYNEDHIVENVTFTDFYIEGVKIESLEDELFASAKYPSRYYTNVQFK